MILKIISVLICVIFLNACTDTVYVTEYIYVPPDTTYIQPDTVRIESPILSAFKFSESVKDSSGLTLSGFYWIVKITPSSPLRELELILRIFSSTGMLISRNIGYPTEDVIEEKYSQPFPYTRQTLVDSLAWGYVAADLLDGRKISGARWNLTTSFEVGGFRKEVVIDGEFRGGI